MTRFAICLSFFLANIYSLSFGQVADDFSDGSFLSQPTWIGDTSDFVVNEEKQLQLNAPAQPGLSQLTIESEVITDAEWSLYVKLAFNPSSNNYLDIYLVSDQMDLTKSLNGYFVRIGNSADEVSLYLQTGSKSSAQKIIDGADDRVDESTVEINVKATRSKEGMWELLVDPALTKNYISEGTVVDSTHNYSNYFGLVCNYTTTRSTRFYIDDLQISGEIFVDNTPPRIDSLVVLSDSSIQLQFSEKMLQSSIESTNNYIVNNGVGSPTSIEFANGNTVILTFSRQFEDSKSNEIAITTIFDLFGNTLPDTVARFTYEAPYLIGFGDIIITEIMADPTPGIDLPEYEYLELHNSKNDDFLLENVALIVGTDSTMIPSLVLKSGAYIILCQHAAVEQMQKFGETVKITNWPSLNNRGERITIKNIKNEIVYSVDYNETWYKSVDKDDGGYSLEMIDVGRPCLGAKNWTASIDPEGGTPGQENASKSEIVDTSPPEIKDIIATSDHSINIQLSESIGPQTIDTNMLSLTPEIEIDELRLLQPAFADLLITFKSEIKPKEVYELKLKNLADCSGNIQKGFVSNFVLPEQVDSLDLIINEVLFDPLPGGVDFVEIYNQSEKYIDLSTISIGNDRPEQVSADHLIIKPQQFMVISESAPILQNHYPRLDILTIVTPHNMPTFNNDEGDVYLMNNNGDILDFFHYSADFHSRFLADKEGVSLERISYENATNDANNWQSASSSVGFASPGKENSQALQSHVKEAEIVIEPKVFVPGDLGFQSFTTIKCQFTNAGNMANIYILDHTGRKIKTILSHKSIGVHDSYKWEGLDDNGQQVRMGPYIVYIEVFNIAGSKKLYREKVVVGGKL